jgi:hypothetical protein
VVAKTWQDIDNCGELAGRDAYSGNDKLAWRDAAAGVDAPASQRILCELLWYFEHEGYAMTNGLTQEQLELARQAMEIEDTLRALIDATTPRIVREKFGRYRLETPRGGGSAPRGQNFKVPAGSWIEKWRGGLWLGYDADATSGRRARDMQLQIQVGTWLPKKEARVLDERRAFRDQLNHFQHDFDDGGWIAASAPVSTFIKSGASETMDAQAARISEWAVPQLRELLSLKPGRHPG